MLVPSNPPSQFKVAAVVLTYNSHLDLPECLSSLIAQTGIALRIIVVDNASSDESRAQMLETFTEARPDGVVVDAPSAAGSNAPDTPHDLFVINGTNNGYSAGNNIGARLAAKLECDAVLIINPDVRLNDPAYIQSLTSALFSDRDNALAASSVVNLSGVNENPMHELGFMEELLWPLWMVMAFIGLRRSSGSIQNTGPVEKISGSCFLARSSFLQEIGFFDEGVFLYCEEAILSVQVKAEGKKIAYLPEIEAVHAHVTSRKGDPVKRMQAWTASRRYYHRMAGYGALPRGLLHLSQKVVIALTYLKQLMAPGRKQ